MSRKLAALNVVVLSAMFVFFVWSNMKPERLVLVSVTRNEYSTVLQGPGWPLSAYKNKANGKMASPFPEKLFQESPYEKDNAAARISVWIVNGPIGFFLILTFAMNLISLTRKKESNKGIQSDLDSAALPPSG